MLATDHFDFPGYFMDDYQQPLRNPHCRRVVLQTFSRIARKTGCDHDEPDGAISAGYSGAGQRNYSGPTMPLHSESKESGLPDCKIFDSTALPHSKDRGSAGGCHGIQMLFAGKQSSIGTKVQKIRLACLDRNNGVLYTDDMHIKNFESVGLWDRRTPVRQFIATGDHIFVLYRLFHVVASHKQRRFYAVTHCCFLA